MSTILRGTLWRRLAILTAAFAAAVMLIVSVNIASADAQSCSSSPFGSSSMFGTSYSCNDGSSFTERDSILGTTLTGHDSYGNSWSATQDPFTSKDSLFGSSVSGYGVTGRGYTSSLFGNTYDLNYTSSSRYGGSASYGSSFGTSLYDDPYGWDW